MRKKTKTTPLFDVIFDVVRSIPEGTVASYGQIAAVVGRCSPLMVGFAMAAAPFDSDVPWHRVVNHRSYRFKSGSVGVPCLLSGSVFTLPGQGGLEAACQTILLFPSVFALYIC
jgi:hypothetical protein